MSMVHRNECRRLTDTKLMGDAMHAVDHSHRARVWVEGLYNELTVMANPVVFLCKEHPYTVSMLLKQAHVKLADFLHLLACHVEHRVDHIRGTHDPLEDGQCFGRVPPLYKAKDTGWYPSSEVGQGGHYARKGWFEKPLEGEWFTLETMIAELWTGDEYRLYTMNKRGRPHRSSATTWSICDVTEGGEEQEDAVD